MMMQRKSYFTIVFLAFCLNFALAQDDFLHKIPLNGITDEWHQIELPEAVFTHGDANLNDLRILGKKSDGSTIEAPYILRFSKSTNSSENRPFRMLNESSNRQGHFYTFALGSAAITNKIHLNIANQNYDWRIHLEGSNDQKEWFEIVKDYRIFGFQNPQVSYHFSDILFPESQYKFYRLLVPSKEKPLNLHAELSFLKEKDGIFRNAPIQNFTQIVDTEKKISIIDFDVDSDFPVSIIQVHIGDNIDYVRRMKIIGLTPHIVNKDSKPFYRDILSGTLTSMEPNRFSIRPIQLNHVKIHIWNQDNQPLKIDSITLRSPLHYLEARFTEDADYSLVFGNKSLRKPNYDIVNFQDKIPENLTALALGALQSKEVEKEVPTEPLFQNKAWLWGIMVLIIGVLGWFSVRMLSAEDY